MHNVFEPSIIKQIINIIIIDYVRKVIYNSILFIICKYNPIYYINTLITPLRNWTDLNQLALLFSITVLVVLKLRSLSLIEWFSDAKSPVLQEIDGISKLEKPR